MFDFFNKKIKKIMLPEVNSTVEGDVDSTRSQTGELMPTDPSEYRLWLKSKIIEQVEIGDYKGINPISKNGLGDDLDRWAYTLSTSVSYNEVLTFLYKLEELKPEDREDSIDKELQYFWDKLSKLKTTFYRIKFYAEDES